MLAYLATGIILGILIALCILSILLEAGKIQTALKILQVKKRYAEIKTPNK
jgi:hypothetical protein